MDKILSVLGVVFVTMKLTNYIDWSWWFVTLPFYGPVVLFLVFFIIGWFLTKD